MTTFQYYRTIKFADTDAAGVVYFANLLSICHEAYEAYLSNILKLNLPQFFQNQSTAIPIIHAEIDFKQALVCGDRIVVSLVPQLVNEKVFEITYTIYKDNATVAQARTRHICINPQTRETQALPPVFSETMSHPEKHNH